MIEIKQLPAGKDESLEAISNQMQVLTQEIASLKHQPAQSSILVRYQAAIIIGMIALLIIIAAVGISYILR